VKALPGPLYVVKSQIHAGGRGKGKFKELGPDAKGGVRLAKSVEEVVANAKEMLGNTLVTKQTGPAGKQVNRLYIEDGADIARELYLSMLVDRTVGRVAFVVSTEGGMDIEASRTTRRKRSSPFSIDLRPAGVTAGRRRRSTVRAEARRRRRQAARSSSRRSTRPSSRRT
jgi:succinyl-CoA synthetase beta subunit